MRDWAVPFVLFALLLGAWAVASPVGSSADEPTTILHAAALVRGELTGRRPPPGTPERSVALEVTAPLTFAHVYHACYATVPTRSAECAGPPVSAVRTPTSAETLVARYPPLYYAVVGLPSYLPGGVRAVIAMRLAGAALNALLLAMAVVAIRFWARSRAVLLGFALAATPMALYFGSVINPSGLELSSTLCLWVAATIWALDHGANAPPGLVWTAAISGALVVQSRPASLAWLLVVVVVTAPLWPAGWWRLRRLGVDARGALVPRRLRGPFALVAASGAFAAVWFVTMHPLVAVAGDVPAPGTSPGTLLRESVGLMPSYLKQGVGLFGWLDTPIPSEVTVFWYAVVAALLLAALVLGTNRQRMSVLASMAFSFAVPVFGTLASVHTRGFSSQGRYFLPVFMGMPIIASAVLGKTLAARRMEVGTATARRLVGGALLLIGLGQLAAFGAALRRFAVGVDGPVLPWANPKGAWHPPIPTTALDLAAAPLVLLLYLYLAAARPRSRVVAAPGERRSVGRAPGALAGSGHPIIEGRD